MNEYKIQYLDVDKLLSMKAVYQRPLRQSDVQSYADHWDMKLCDPIRVARYPDGSEEIVDGQHRCAAFKQRFGSGKIHCFVAPVKGKPEAARWFLESNTKRRLLSGAGLWVGGIEAEDPHTLLVETLCRQFQIELKDAGSGKTPGVLSCRGALLEIVKRSGEERLRQVLRVVSECWRNYTFFLSTAWIKALGSALDVAAKDPKFDEEMFVARLQAARPEEILSRLKNNGRYPSVPRGRNAILDVVYNA